MTKHKPACPYCSHKFHWSEATELNISVGTYFLCPNCDNYLAWSVTIYPPDEPPRWGIPIPDNLEAIHKAEEQIR